MSTLSSTDRVQELARTGQEAIHLGLEAFHEWIQQVIHLTSPLEWYCIIYILGCAELPAETLDITTFRDHRNATYHVLADLLKADHLSQTRSLYSLFTVTNSGDSDKQEVLIEPEEFCVFLHQAAQIETNRQQVKASISLREMIYEIDPTSISNLKSLIYLYAKVGDSLSVELYSQVLVESIPDDYINPDLNSNANNSLYVFLASIFQLGQIKACFSILYELIDRYENRYREPLNAWVTIFLKHYFSGNPLYSNQESYHPCSINDLLVLKFWERFFRYSEQYGYSIMARSLERLSEDLYYKRVVNPYLSPITSYISVAANSLYYYSLSAKSEQAKRILNSILQRYPFELAIGAVPELEKYALVEIFLFTIYFCLVYAEDDIRAVYSRQLNAARYYSNLTRQKYPELLWDESCFIRKEQKAPLRVGYLSTSFRCHSVGYLCHQTIGQHRQENIEVYCYQYEISPQPDDCIFQSLQSSVPNFRDLSIYQMDLRSIVEQVRADKLDVLVYMDSLTSTLGCQLVSMRLAPIQISWLGGDTPGLPEIDYVIVDSWLLPEQAQGLLSEKLIRLPTFVAVDSLDVDDPDPWQARQRLGVSEQTVVFWSAAIAHKRSRECVQAQIEILRQVPDSVLVVKGIGDIASVIEEYKAAAGGKHVDHKLRFIAWSTRNEQHRSQLSCVDLILDTFPYTGATHTVEALYVGVPVLTRVGGHYYGRMSYSILKSVGLDACITFSVDEYIQQGIKIALDPDLRNSLKKKAHDSRRFSLLWDARGFAESLESLYRQLVNECLQNEIILENPS